jgi:putative radical SAM enzyme (TIGR03279 family)
MTQSPSNFKHNTTVGARVATVAEDSVAARGGIIPGDFLLAVNGHDIHDVLDLKFYLSEREDDCDLVLRNPEGRLKKLHLQTATESKLGFELEEIQTLICKNQCVFCFVFQLPKTARKSLWIKDEDFRLAFLYGNYMTLTNVNEDEMDRIIEQRLLPLYISVHATEPDIREKLIRPFPGVKDDLLPRMKRLADHGIVMHTQIVLCPGWNDGRHLARTLRDLFSFHPQVQSVAVVPLGLTDHRSRLPQMEPVDAAYARRTIEFMRPIQKAFRKKIGSSFAYLGDEFYLMAHEPIPSRRHYGQFPLLENGVGMVRQFLDQFSQLLERKAVDDFEGMRGIITTGKVFAPILTRCISQFNERFKCNLQVVAVENHYLGKGITVAGLLSGSDLLAALKGRHLGEFVMVPSEAMINEDYLLLDDFRRADMEQALGVQVLPSGYSPREFFDILKKRDTMKFLAGAHPVAHSQLNDTLHMK